MGAPNITLMKHPNITDLSNEDYYFFCTAVDLQIDIIGFITELMKHQQKLNELHLSTFDWRLEQMKYEVYQLHTHTSPLHHLPLQFYNL